MVTQGQTAITGRLADAPPWMQLAARLRRPLPADVPRELRDELAQLVDQARDDVDRAHVVLIALAMGNWQVALDTRIVGDAATDWTVQLAFGVHEWALGKRPRAWTGPPPEGHLAMAAAFFRLATGHVDEAASHLQAAARGQFAPGSAADLARLAARCAARLRDPALANLAIAVAPQQMSERHVVDLARWLLEAGAFAAATQWLQASSNQGDEVRIAWADLLSWRAQWRQVLECLQDIAPTHVAAERLRGVAHLGLGDARTALVHLDAAIQAGDDSAAIHVHRGEALLALGDVDGAAAEALSALGRQNLLAAHVLLGEALLGSRHRFRWLRNRLPRGAGWLDGLLAEEFGALLKALQIAEPTRDADMLAATFRQVRERLGGNRTDTTTYLDKDGALHLFQGRGSRDKAASTLQTLRQQHPDEVAAALAALAKAQPASPHPFTYAGELQLWLGDLERAAQMFAAANAVRPCRWAYVGTSAVCMMRGQTWRARGWAFRTRRRFGELHAATTHVYRGELARLRGDYRAAQRDLEVAVAAKPSRIGAWMNLALVYDALGQHDQRDQVLRRLAETAPVILWLAHEALGHAGRVHVDAANAHQVLGKALEMMRGNRSSIIHTLFVDGQLRVMAPPAEVKDLARTVLVALLDAARLQS